MQLAKLGIADFTKNVILNEGTSKVSTPYKIGEKTTDIMLEVLNLDKKEAVAIDTLSNQEFSEVRVKVLYDFCAL